jgi:hypothetical protein
MNAVIDRKLMRLGNILVVTMAIILASIIIAVAQVMTTGDAAVPPQQTEPARVLLKPPPAKPRIAMPDNIAPSAPVGDALKKLLAEHRCLAEVMYFEARGEGPVGQAAIARVIFHRLASGGHGSTICAVVYEGAHQTFCQFTFACDGSLDRPRVPEPWRAAQVGGQADGGGIPGRRPDRWRHVLPHRRRAPDLGAQDGARHADRKPRLLPPGPEAAPGNGRLPRLVAIGKITCAFF